MKPFFAVLLANALTLSFAAAEQNELAISIGQADLGTAAAGGRRFFVSGLDSPIFVVISNLSDKPQRVWQIWNSWGAPTIVLEVVDQQGNKLGLIRNGQIAWTMNGPTFDTIAPREHHIIPISIDHTTQWILDGDKLKTLKREEWHKVRIRATFTSRDGEKKGVWSGTTASKLYDFEFRIRERYVPDKP